MRLLRFLLRLAGWLLTPLVAWAASFTGAMLGATLARSSDTALTGVLVTVLVGLVFALLGTHAWLRLVRRSPELRAALQLGPDGAPIIPEPPVEPQPGPVEGDGPG
jgi:hypothetical protein